MKLQIVQITVSLYRLLLRLYPRQFREEFGQEMTAVFTQALTQADQSLSGHLAVFWRELIHFPGALLREHSCYSRVNPMSTNKKRFLYLLVLLILGYFWRLFATSLWGHSDNWGLILALLVYGPFFLASIIIICWILAVIFPPIINRMNPNVWIVGGLLTLTALFIPSSVFGDEIGMMPIVQISLALVIVGLLLYVGLTQYTSNQEDETLERTAPLSRLVNRTAVIPIGLSLLLLLKALQKLYWLHLWDITYDSVGPLWTIYLTVVILFSGIPLTFSLPAKRQWVGIIYCLLLPVLVFGVFKIVQQVDIYQLTEDRAARTSRAVEAFYGRQGHYPESLEQLTPWYLLSVPDPGIIYGQKWCYDSGSDYYRLGYVNREHWSAPYLIGTLHRSAGEIPDLPPLCRAEVTVIQEQHPNFPYEYMTASE